MPLSSRGDFLKIAGQGTLAAGLYMDLPHGAWLTADAEETQGGASFIDNKLECDVLVIGGGWAGLFAAIKAKEQGAQVILVSKGLAGRSGQSPWASGTLVFRAKEGDKLDEWMSHAHSQSEFLNNQYWTETTITQSYDRYQDCIAYGLKFEPGQNNLATPASAADKRASFRGINFAGKPGDLPFALRQHALKIGIKIIDRVMVAELLKQNGRIVGAIGISANSYDMYTFAAKTTVICTGACSYKPLNYPPGHQLTGDGEAMAFRSGAEVLGKEFIHTMWTVRGLPAGGMATALRVLDENQVPENLRELRAASIMGQYMVDAAGNRLGAIPAGATEYPLTYLQLEFAAHDGRAPLYTIGRNNTKMEVVGGACLGMSIRNADGLWPADKQCGTTLPGLYAAGDSLGTIQNGAVYTMTGSSSMGAMVQGAIAGAAAAEEAAQMGKPEVNADEIASAKKSVTASRERKGGFSPRWVTQLLQNTMAPYYIYSVKHADRLQAAITQIEFMHHHLIPALLARDPHEVCLANEIRSMVLSAEIRLRSALFRTESRGNHYREDFPRRDDENWMAWTKVAPVQGKMSLVKVPIPKEWWPDQSIPYEQRYPYRYQGES